MGYLETLGEGRNTAIKYVQVLSQVLPNVRLELSETLGIKDPIFIHDNSSIHTSKLVRQWLKDNDWVVAKHPACSPDLNPIEHIWAYMKRQLHKRFPHLMNMPGEPAAVKEALADALHEIWKGIPESLLESLYSSMPRRIAAVIKPEGWYTKY